jgi:hypothetical protein
MNFHTIIDKIRKDSVDNKYALGDKFERMIQLFFLSDSVYRD